MDAMRFLDETRKIFTVTPTDNPRPEQGQGCAMYVAGQWYKLSWRVDPAASPVEKLDVSVLQERLLAPILGIDDPRTSKRIAFLGGIRGPEALQKLVDSGEAVAAFSMFPVTVAEVMAIADAGQIMPPKSTWFEPKLRSGVAIHTLD